MTGYLTSANTEYAVPFVVVPPPHYTHIWWWSAPFGRKLYHHQTSHILKRCTKSNLNKIKEKLGLKTCAK